MANILLNRKRDKDLNDFAREYRDRTLTYLSSAFSMGKEDCEDVFQESSLILYKAAEEGKLNRLTSSLYTYFIGICNNKAHEQLRANGRIPLSSIDDFSSEDGEKQYNVVLNKADRILGLIEANERAETERNGIIEDMVRNLPSPCNELLWSYYRDALSMKAIAQMYNYANENVAKVKKHHCQEKFRKRYEEAINKL